MARPGESEASRLRKLETALGRARSIKPGEVFAFTPMKELLGVSVNTLREWCDEPDIDQSGAFIRGGNGVAWEFNPVAMIWVLIRHFERKRDALVNENQRIRDMVGGDKLAGVPVDFNLTDTKRMVDLHLQLRSAEEADGTLIEAATAAEAVTAMVRDLRETVLTAPQEMDPTNSWDTEFREKFDSVLSRFMLRLQAAGRDCVKKLRPNGPLTTDTDAQGRGSSRRKGVG